jgi:hypothetical protein
MMLLLAQTFSKWLIIIDFQMNKAYIAKDLCVNKTKPKMHCNGNCQMMKKMAEEEKENSSPINTNNHKITSEETVYFHKTIVPTIVPIEEERLKYNSIYNFSKLYAPVSSIFRPPAVA